MKYHTPVLLNEVTTCLAVSETHKVIDCTLGDGGHSIELLKKGSFVLGIDVSDYSIDRATKRITELSLEKRFTAVKGNFKDLETLARENDFGGVNAILFDLGYSSAQLEESDIGLSFLANLPLDMRLDKKLGVTAADLLATLSQKQLERILKEYGGENLAKKFSAEIVKARDLKKLHTTKDLADLIRNAAPLGYERGRIHPATRTFQALRIAVNSELENLRLGLTQAARILLPGGRMAIISFHSLEDRIVKTFGANVQSGLMPMMAKPVMPSPEEVRLNVRARSAKMRVYEKI